MTLMRTPGHHAKGRPAGALPSLLVLCFAALFAVAFAAGRLAGPVAPGMHHTAPGTVPADGHDMGRMTMSGERR
ncbi:hypothetical protein [Actinoallomurus sp. NPDC050550]|uniref:hypothetical protein n=1 Tax=Actinoallomurus sp. NPDC050550 TaxID=3154937 RepID=UPI0033CB1F00